MNYYDESELLLQKSVKKFSEKHILPNLDKWEEAKEFPSDLFVKLGDEGFLGLLTPENVGGIGGSHKLAAAWCEEFGRIPAVGLSIAVNMHSLVIVPALVRNGSDALITKWVDMGLSGRAIGAYAFTEPGAGSDLSSIQTKAVKTDSGWLLNGSKIFITNGKRAGFVIVLAKTDPNAGYKGFSSFVVDTSLPGFSVSRTLDKLGWHSSDTAEIVFKDMELPEDSLLGSEGKGWEQSMQSLEWERLMLSLSAVGGAFQCLEDTIRYVNERSVFGKTVGSYRFNRDLLSKLWLKMSAGQAMCYHCLDLLQAGSRCRKEVSLAKIYVSELATHIADRCLQLHGGYGYTTEFRPERWLRDLRLNSIGGGTSEILAEVAIKESLKN